MKFFGSNTGLLRVRKAHEHSRVPFVELFFDLVFVFAITQISHFLLEHFTLAGVLQAALLFLAVWWVWIYTSWVTNWLDPETAPVRLLMFALMLAGLVLSCVLIARQNLAQQGITSGFAFLFKSTGWDISFSLLPATANDPYWWYFLVGIVNTLFLGSVGLILATIVGTIVGLARTSSNELARLLGRTYVDIFRNIPLILQVFFWYAVITHLPSPRAAE